MKNLALLFVCVVGFGLPEKLPAQTLETLLEDYAEDEAPELSELLAALVREPLEINQIPADSIAALWFLDANQRAALVELKKEKPHTITQEDLVAALGLPAEIVAILFSDASGINATVAGRARMRWQKAGSQKDFRMRIKTSSFDSGVLNEQDPGENRYNDFMTGYLSGKFFAGKLQVLAGDFTIQSATGLLFAGAYGTSSLGSPKNAIVFNEAKLLPYRGLGENTAFRGLASRWDHSGLSLTGFHSEAFRDARLDTSGKAVTLLNTGYHRNASEEAARKTLLEKSSGIIIGLSASTHVHFALHYLRQHYNHLILPEDSIRQRFAFRGDHRYFAGISAQITDDKQRQIIFAEGAHTDRSDAIVVGGRLTLPVGTITTAFWHADAGFSTNYGALPGHRLGETANETAFYVGVTTRNRLGHFTLYVLRSYTPWRTYLFPQPTAKQEGACQWQGKLARAVDGFARLRYRVLPEQTDDPDGYRQQAPTRVIAAQEQLALRTHLAFQTARRIRYLLRLDWNWISHPQAINEKGLAQMHELQYRMHKVFTLGIRYSYFSTEGYDSRLYQFEAALPGLVQPVVLNGTGERISSYGRLDMRGLPAIAVYFTTTHKLDANTDRYYGLQIQF